MLAAFGATVIFNVTQYIVAAFFEMINALHKTESISCNNIESVKNVCSCACLDVKVKLSPVLPFLLYSLYIRYDPIPLHLLCGRSKTQTGHPLFKCQPEAVIHYKLYLENVYIYITVSSVLTS